MSADEKRIAVRVADAWDGVIDKKMYIELDDRDLIELAHLIWAIQVDLGNEWVRRQMLKEEV